MSIEGERGGDRAVLNEVLDALGPLSPEARSKVVQMVCTFYDLDLRSVSQRRTEQFTTDAMPEPGRGFSDRPNLSTRSSRLRESMLNEPLLLGASVRRPRAATDEHSRPLRRAARPLAAVLLEVLGCLSEEIGAQRRRDPELANALRLLDQLGIGQEPAYVAQRLFT